MKNLFSRKKHIAFFKDLTIKDVPLVGGKNASLGEMYRDLTKKGVNIPNGFAVTALSYQYFFQFNGLTQKITPILKALKVKDIQSLQKTGREIRNLITSSQIPLDLASEIKSAYLKLSREYKANSIDVAVRSSATAEDLPGASFAGQQATFLNVKGDDELLQAVKECFASLFTDRAISYRVDKGFDHLKTYLSVGIQKMVRSDKASSGVMFTLDPDTGFPEVVVINGVWGLGELIVQGEVIPDEFLVFKPTFKKGFNSIISQKVGSKEKSMVYGTDKGDQTKVINTSPDKQNKLTLNDFEVLKLAKWATQIEDHYKKPMDIEWAKDGLTNTLYIVQARPETIHASSTHTEIEEYSLKEKGEILTKGISVGTKIGQGKANIILDAKDINRFKKGEVLVTRITDPDWEPIMKIASAIVTSEGGRTSHAAIVSRELGIPCIVGTGNATIAIKAGQDLTIDCSSGADGFVYKGNLKWEVKKFEVKNLRRPKDIKIYVNIGSPNEAFQASFLPSDGVGLAREEFIIASQIKVHPLSLIHYDKLKDQKAKSEILKLTKNYPKKTDFYTEQLSFGIAKIAAAFYPKPVILRFSDFKTNEYASLLGGSEFEPKEENPMIGWRGASRYYDPQFEEAFGLECQAVLRVRNSFGLKNLIVMVPFCRTPEEGRRVLETMAKYGLKKGQNSLKVYMMCEIPSNVIEAEEFLKIFDGFSIGSNDLSQLTLGIDRDNATLSKIANENDPAVKEMIASVIRAVKKHKKYIGICGQAPSDYPNFAKFLVTLGIDSISLNPDTVIKTTIEIARQESKI